MINCELELCIYNRNARCILRKASIDSAGVCADSTLVILDEEFLKAEKEKQFSRLAQELEKG